MHQAAVQKNMPSTAKDQAWKTLVGIVPSAGSRPLERDGQYTPAREVDQVRSQMLQNMFDTHRLTKLDRCLDPFSGRHYRELYLATFPDFAAVRSAHNAWNAVDMGENPFMTMIVMNHLEEDKTMSKHLKQPYESSRPETHDKPVTHAPCAPSDTFEQWWAAHDPKHWASHLQNIKHQSALSDNGVWLYISEPDDYTSYSDPATFSYDTPALVEYDLHNRLEETDDLVELIDWYATRTSGRISLHSHVCFTPTAEFASASTSPQSSDCEDRQMDDTPGTTPPGSLYLPYALVSQTDTESESRHDAAPSLLITGCEAQVIDVEFPKRSSSSVDSVAVITTAKEARDGQTPLPLPIPTTPPNYFENIIRPEVEALLAGIFSYADDEPQKSHILFQVYCKALEGSPEALRCSSSPSPFPSIEKVTYRYPHLATSSNIAAGEAFEKTPSKKETAEQHVLITGVEAQVPEDEDVFACTSSAAQHKDNAFEKGEELNMPTIRNTTDLWLKLLLLPLMDYFSLGLLSKLMRYPVLSIAFIVVLLMYSMNDRNGNGRRSQDRSLA
jgi:hypothetical protein